VGRKLKKNEENSGGADYFREIEPLGKQDPL